MWILTKIGPRGAVGALLSPFVGRVAATSTSMVLVVVVSASPIARAATSGVSVPFESRWGLVGVAIRVA